MSLSNSDTDETRFIEPLTTGVDPNVTGLGAPPASDDDVTRFVEPASIDPDPDVTRFVDADVTRFEPNTSGSSHDTDETRFSEAPPASSVRPQSARPPTGSRPRTGGDTRSGARTKEGPTGPLDVGQSFGNRYHIIRVLGIGGMGAVYHAWDSELGMAVALKVIRPESSADPAAVREMERRFKQELVLARQVTHKNVVRIHDLGEIDGIKYITMPYLDGSDLSTVLKEHGKMPVPAALGIVRDVAAGLTAAHDAGIVHRDLKPANIMVLKDRAVIMDFGIARSNQLPQEAAAHLAPAEAIDSLKSAAAKTLVGTILGTVQYMAPEQAKGLPVDQRADIYALGLIFLDVLLGKRHTHASSAIEELKTRIELPPPLAQTYDPSIPKPIEQVIARCLEPDPAKRYQTSAELVAALDRLDDKGEVIPIKRVIRLPYAIAAVVLLLTLSGYIWWSMRPPVTHEPVAVVIADFANTTGDTAFDHALGPTLRRALNDASFISAYDRAGISATGVRAPDKLDEATARALAVKQGLGVVVSGSIEPQRGGFKVSVKVTQAVTGEVIMSRSANAGNRDQVLEVATRLMTRVRSALGDDTSESAQLFATRSVSAASLDVVNHYAAAVEAQARGRYESARESYLKAVGLDPKFAIGYQGLAAMALNLGQIADGEKYIKEAYSHIDGLTEREKLTTRGFYLQVMGNNEECVKEYAELLARYPADTGGRNQRAICLSRLRRTREARDEMLQAVKLLPNHMVLRTNLAYLENVLGDFEGAERRIASIPEPNSFAVNTLAFSQVGRGLLREATQTYEKLAGMNARGASLSASGLGDIAIYEGRFQDAVRILERGAASDLAAKDGERAAMKFASSAYAHLMAGQVGPAIAAAEKALDAGKTLAVRFPAARVLAEAGALDRGQAVATELASSPGASHEARVHGKIIEGMLAAKAGKAQEAIRILNEANALLDTWIGQYELGRAHLQAKDYVPADAAFERCITRRGEVVALMDEDPTYGYFPSVYYYLGRARQEVGTAAFTDSYREYLKIRGASTQDPLLADVRRRAGN